MSTRPALEDQTCSPPPVLRTGLSALDRGIVRVTDVPGLRNIDAKSRTSTVTKHPEKTPGNTSYSYGNVVGLVPFKEGFSSYGNVLDVNQARTAFLRPFNELLGEAGYIKHLADGWDDGEGYAPGGGTFNLVKRWVKEAARVLFDQFGIIELKPPELDPTPSGAITIFWRLPQGKLHATVANDPTVRVTYYLETKNTSGQVIDAKKGTYYDSYRFLSDLPPLLATAAGAMPRNRWLDND